MKLFEPTWQKTTKMANKLALLATHKLKKSVSVRGGPFWAWSTLWSSIPFCAVLGESCLRLKKKDLAAGLLPDNCRKDLDIVGDLERYGFDTTFGNVRVFAQNCGYDFRETL